MKRKILSMGLIICMLLTNLTLPTIAEEQLTDGVFTYKIVHGNVTIIKCDSSASGKLVIPDMIGGYPVVNIGQNAFSDCDDITSVVIGSNVQYFEYNSYPRMTNLISIEVAEDNNYYYSEDGVLFNKGKTTILRYPRGKTDKTYTIPDGVEQIFEFAFSYCANLTSIKIPYSVRGIFDNIVLGCENLTIYYEGGEDDWNKLYLGINDDLRNANIIFENVAQTDITSEDIYVYSVLNEEVTITDCDEFASGDLVIPDTLGGYPVTTIGRNAFYNCRYITSAKIPNSVTTIGEGAFLGCTSMMNIDLPDSILSITDSTFHMCDSLINIKIPDSVTSIGNKAFSLCGNLASIEIPENITSIGIEAFSSCDNLTSIEIPENVTSIGAGAFSECNRLTGIEVAEGNINYSSEDGVLFNKDKTNLICYPCGKMDMTYVIPDSVTSLSSGAFYQCNLSHLEFGNGIKSINDNLGLVGDNLKSIRLPDSVTDIECNAFSFCEQLTSIEVSENNKNYCSEDGVLFNKNKTTLVRYPIAKPDLTYTIPDSVTGIGDYAFTRCNIIQNVEMNDNLTYIGNNAFNNCRSLTNITIGDNVTSIGEYAFYNCYEVKSASIGSGITNIHQYTFFDCRNMVSVNLPETLVDVANSAFYHCSSLTDVYYTGNEEAWNKITIHPANAINNANIHYNAKVGDDKKVEISVNVNGNKVVFDQPPVIENDRTLVPLRAIFEALGANIGWDDATKTVTASKDGVEISLQIGSNQMHVNEMVKILDVPAKIINSRTLVPVRAISEAFNCGVEWIDATKTVVITL